MAKAKRKLKGPEIAAPQSREEAERMLGRLGELQRQVDAIEGKMNDRLARIKAEYEERAAPITEEIEATFAAVQAWAESHKSDLLAGRAKSVRITTGELGWRTTPPKVHLRQVKVVLEALKRHGLQRFIRLKEAVNKEAILAEPEAVKGIKGISIKSSEEFWVRPFESEIERAAAAVRRKK